jgi:hypothetical protein
MTKVVGVFHDYTTDLLTALLDGHAACMLDGSSTNELLYLRQTWHEHTPLQDTPTPYRLNTTISNNVTDVKICQARTLRAIRGPIHDS